ncbi:MAG TPA: DUF433 domain-containing protein [Ignavibacteria bacterium]|nr:DUF433 domain-containing protein [Ignavibacteria bacterium]
MKNKYINIDPEILSGTPVFKGTRVPIYILFDYIEGGEPLNAFLENYPSISKEHALNVLKLAEKFVTTDKYVNENIIG